jgi:hypothetical protein
MADESALCAEYLYGKLNVSSVTNALGTAARIYDSEVPQNPISGQTALYPAVVYHQQASSDTYGVGAVRIFVRPLWTVKVVVDNDTYKNASTIFSIVDSVLQNTSGTVTNGSVYACYRESQQIRYSEGKSGGGFYRHVGATYRLEVRATTTP